MEHVEACGSGEESLSIAMFDIDDFKKVNDVYGHLRGNQVLCQFAALLKDASGEQNLAIRYGGEEFLVLMPGCDAAAAFAFAEKLRVAVLDGLALQALTASGFSISGGVAQYQAGMGADGLIHLVDTRLYAAKRSGKNKIIGNT